jgi:hypothetical protein
MGKIGRSGSDPRTSRDASAYYHHDILTWMNRKPDPVEISVKEIAITPEKATYVLTAHE